MLSYQVTEHGKPLQQVFTQAPKPKGTEVLVRITRSGVCHSDLHIWDGYFDLGGGKRFYVKDRGCVPPFTLGHEPFGVVEAFGPGAAKAMKGLKKGQRRLVYPWIGCGKCPVCKSGKDNYCVSGSRFLGINRAGAYSTHLLIPHPRYLVDTALTTHSHPPLPAPASPPTARSPSSPNSARATGWRCWAAAASGWWRSQSSRAWASAT